MTSGSEAARPAQEDGRAQVGRSPAVTRSAVARLVVMSPDLVAPAVAGFSVVAVGCALLALPGYLSLVLSVVAAALAVWAVGRAVRPPVEIRRAEVSGTVLVWLVALGAVVVNARFVGQWFIVERDPGFYATTGRWFATHNFFPMTTNAGDVTQAVTGVSDVGNGYYPAGVGEVFSQGGPLAPIVLGHVQRVIGVSGLQVGNVLLGGLALLAFFAWSRRLLHGWWAVVPPIAFGVSLPVVYVVRSTFSEAISVLLVLGGLALLGRGLALRSPWLAAAGAVVMGTSTLSRVDGVAVGGIVAIVTATLWLLTTDTEPVRTRLVAGAVAVASLATSVVSLAVYQRTTPLYLHDLWSEVRLELVGLVGAAAVLLILAVLWPTGAARSERILAVRTWVRLRLGIVVGGATALALVFLVLRPLWMVGRDVLDPASGYQRTVGATQVATGLPLDPARTYDELTVISTAWYFGWAVLLLSIVGFALVAVRHGRDLRADWTTALGAAVLLVPLYFWAWHITPDQLWASRHLVMLGYPLLLVMATYAASYVVRHTRLARLPSGGRLALALGLSALLVLPAVVTTRPLARIGQYGGFAALITQTCDAIDASSSGDATPVVVLTGVSGRSYLGPVAVWCDVPAVRPTTAASATNDPAADAQAVAGVAAWGKQQGRPVVQVDISRKRPASVPAGGVLLTRTVTIYDRAVVSAPDGYGRTTFYVTVSPVG